MKEWKLCKPFIFLIMPLKWGAKGKALNVSTIPSLFFFSMETN
jgi:hypothetical protein